MTQLLVSVRSLAECDLVLRTGVALVDLKEPRHGSLGASDVSTVAAVAARMADDGRPWSLALGELREISLDRVNDRTLLSPHYAKVGLSGTANWPDWQNCWLEVIQAFPQGTSPVAVAYADVDRATAVPWQEVLDTGVKFGCRVLLIDTFDKSAGRLTQWMSECELSEVRKATLSQGVSLALAGSLTNDDILALSKLGPEWFAVRSLVTSADRADPIDLGRVQMALELMRSTDDASVTCDLEARYGNS